MPRSLARLSASESSHRDLSSAVFITNIAESDFRYTQGHELGVYPRGPEPQRSRGRRDRPEQPLQGRRNRTAALGPCSAAPASPASDANRVRATESPFPLTINGLLQQNRPRADAVHAAMRAGAGIMRSHRARISSGSWTLCRGRVGLSARSRLLGLSSARPKRRFP
jgi:hypothetical protein